MQGESHPDGGGTDAGIEGILDGLADQGRDMPVVQLAIARPNKKLFLERVSLDRCFRANREIPGNVTHDRAPVFFQMNQR